MAIQRQTASPLDGTPGQGLFDFGGNTGGRNLQVKINSITLEGANTAWTVGTQEPDGTDHLVLSDTNGGSDAYMGGPGGFMVLPTEDDGEPWKLRITMTGAGPHTAIIDYDIIGTEG